MDKQHSDLWALEEDFWLGGAEVYRRHLADEAVMLFPGMVLQRADTIASIESAPRWASVSFADQQVLQLVPDAVVLIYRASASREQQDAPYAALVSSVYARRDGAWKLIVHQQSPDSGR